MSTQPYPLPLVSQLVQEAGILSLTFYQERVSKPCLDSMKECNSVFIEKWQLAKVILADLSQPCQMYVNLHKEGKIALCCLEVK